jgi:polysaccharide export outer membrane protein
LQVEAGTNARPKRELKGTEDMKLKWKAAVATVLVAASIAFAQDAPAASAPSTAVPSAQSWPSYVIGPEDVLHIAVWKEADLSVTLPVRPDGKVSLPLLNDVQAAGLTPEQLKDSVAEKLKKFISDPRVTVVVTQINSKRIYLAGEVAHTGAMPMSPNMTVMQALASAGMNQFANTKKIYLLRSDNGKQEKLPVPYRKLIKGEEMEHNYVLQPGDTIVVP